MTADVPLATVIAEYLRTLQDVSDSTRRQRRWALEDLLAAAPSPDVGLLAHLSPAQVSSWLAAAGSQGPGGAPPSSLPGLRARASAVRHLARHAHADGLLTADHVAAIESAAQLPKPGRAPVKGADAVDVLLASSSWDARPVKVHPDVWARFGAHVHLLAATGATERALSQLTVPDLDMTGSQVTVPGQSQPVPLDKRTVAVTRTWLEHRKSVVSQLQGSDPSALWVRVRPSGDRVTERIHQAGLPITQRGLRWAFQDTRDQLAVTVPEVAGVEIRAIRAHRRPVATQRDRTAESGSVPGVV